MVDPSSLDLEEIAAGGMTPTFFPSAASALIDSPGVGWARPDLRNDGGTLLRDTPGSAASPDLMPAAPIGSTALRQASTWLSSA